ncbi:MAG TPA: DUF134 domain-containing protein [Bacteroidales bacterium]|nr:DUF134 domain-containing protein [Bacteroidales bacterium]
MPRPRQNRKLKHQPHFKGFKPIGIPQRKLGIIDLFSDEYEVIHLLDYDNLSQEEAAKAINVSRPTLTRIYQSARRKIAKALSDGLSIHFVISPHAYFVQDYFCRACHSFFELTSDTIPVKCPKCHSDKIIAIKHKTAHKQYKHQGLYFPSNGRRNKTSYCICRQCGKKYPHVLGIRCMEMECTECGGSLLREDFYPDFPETKNK